MSSSAPTDTVGKEAKLSQIGGWRMSKRGRDWKKERESDRARKNQVSDYSVGWIRPLNHDSQLTVWIIDRLQAAGRPLNPVINCCCCLWVEKLYFETWLQRKLDKYLYIDTPCISIVGTVGAPYLCCCPWTRYGSSITYGCRMQGQPTGWRM